MSWDSSGILKFDLQTPTGDLTIFHMILSELTGAVPNTRYTKSSKCRLCHWQSRIPLDLWSYTPFTHIYPSFRSMVKCCFGQLPKVFLPRFKVCRFSCKLLSVSSWALPWAPYPQNSTPGNIWKPNETSHINIPNPRRFKRWSQDFAIRALLSCRNILQTYSSYSVWWLVMGIILGVFMCFFLPFKTMTIQQIHHNPHL